MPLDPREIKVNRPKYLGRSKTPLCDVVKAMMSMHRYDEKVAMELVLRRENFERVRMGIQFDSTAMYVAGEIYQRLKDGV